MQIPPIARHTTCREFFKSFYDLNKVESSKNSLRAIAKKLQWPPAYLSDLKSGRRNLTALRAIQFSKFAKMDDVDLERLLHMTMLNDEHDEVRTYAKRKLAHSGNHEMAGQGGLPLDFVIESVSSLVRWIGRVPAAAEISEILSASYAGITTSYIEAAFEKLEKSGLICRDQAGNKILNAPIQATDCSKNTGGKKFIKFCSPVKEAAELNSGILVIPTQSIPEVERRFQDLKNWLLTLWGPSQILSNSASKAALLCHYDLNLFAIVDLELIKQKFGDRG